METDWLEIVDDILRTQTYCRYKGGWVMHKLQEYGVPGKAWSYACKILNQDMSWWSSYFNGLNVDNSAISSSKVKKIANNMSKERSKIDKRMGKTLDKWREKLDDAFL